MNDERDRGITLEDLPDSGIEGEGPLHTGFGDCWIRPDTPCYEVCVAFNNFGLEEGESPCSFLQMIKERTAPDVEREEAILDVLQKVAQTSKAVSDSLAGIQQILAQLPTARL